MNHKKLPIQGAYLFTPKEYKDNRGLFREEYRLDDFMAMGIVDSFNQENYSKSVKNVIRGLHYQEGHASQAKLVKCLSGNIYDVIVDIRKESPTWGKWCGVDLDNSQLVFVPRGCAHGFSVLSDSAEVLYKCSKIYNPKAERGIIYNDPQLHINWKVKNPIVSKKDLALPFFINSLGDICSGLKCHD